MYNYTRLLQHICTSKQSSVRHSSWLCVLLKEDILVQRSWSLGSQHLIPKEVLPSQGDGKPTHMFLLAVWVCYGFYGPLWGEVRWLEEMYKYM